jgi:hypothetical protein
MANADLNVSQTAYEDTSDRPRWLTWIMPRGFRYDRRTNYRL